MNKTAITDTFHDVKEQLYNLSHRFRKEHPGAEWSEVISEAFESYCKCYHNYDRSRGARFLTYLTFKVWKDLLSKAREIAQENNLLKQKDIEAATLTLWGEHGGSYWDHVPDKEPLEEFDKKGFFGKLSEDAAIVARLALDNPIEIRVSTIQRSGNIDTPKGIRAAIYEFLRDLGWDRERIYNSYREIQEALS